MAVLKYNGAIHCSLSHYAKKDNTHEIMFTDVLKLNMLTPPVGVAVQNAIQLC